MTGCLPIMVGADGSAMSLDAVRWAAEDAARRRAPLWIVSVLPDPCIYCGPGFPSSLVVDRETTAKARLAEAAVLAADAAKELGAITVRTEFVVGAAIPALLERAASARMVVLGLRGLAEFSGGLVGSVASALAEHAPCLVAIVRGVPSPGQAAFPGGVVVGVDGTRSSESVIAAAFEEASLRGVALTAVHAVTDFSVATVFANIKEVDWPTSASAGDMALAESLAGWSQQYPDVVVRKVVVKDHPAQNLIRHAESAQLLVVGSHGRGGFAGMLLGSTSRTLIHKAECPLLIVRSA
ncbi:MAG: universal stress protein [Mycobacteriaceae bacterium]